MKSNDDSLFRRVLFFVNPFDARYEDLKKGGLAGNIIKDLTAGLVVALVAIPLAMGFAMASGLRPEQGIVGGAVAGLLGALFGGSKYQVYGPTAAYIPIIGGLMATYDHGFLILASLIAGILLLLSGLFQLGQLVARVPNSIIVGFTFGIAIVIAFSQMGEVLGYESAIGYGLDDQIENIIDYSHEFHPYAPILAIGTTILCFVAKRISPFVPGPLLGLGFGLLAVETFWSGQALMTVSDKFGAIPSDFFELTWPVLPTSWSAKVILDLIYYVVAIYFVAAVESLLCSRMADRLAANKGTPFHPNKEFWGQGMVNIITPMFNGFPHTGALARTAVNIKLGAVSPLAGIAKFVFKLTIATYLAAYLSDVPMACIGGVLLYVAMNMVKVSEIKEIIAAKSNIHIFLLLFTGISLPFLGFLTSVFSALGIFLVLHVFRNSLLIRRLDTLRISITMKSNV